MIYIRVCMLCMLILEQIKQRNQQDEFPTPARS